MFVTVGDEEREVGSYPGATPDEALQYFARKYDELAASADLLEARLANPDVSAKEVADGLATLKEHVETTGVVGDCRRCSPRWTGSRPDWRPSGARGGAPRRGAGRGRAARGDRRRGGEDRGQPPGSTQWKTSGERMRTLLEEWKQHQRTGPRLDKATESALWQRFSHARNSFDKARRAWFADLESSRADARVGQGGARRRGRGAQHEHRLDPTARAFKQLMDRWRAAGRASRAEDDALWERFRTAQDAFFTAKDKVAAAEDEEFRSNLVVKEELLTEAEALLPVTDVEAAKAALRGIQDRWEKAGKVPRADLERVEKRMRRVETAVREADEQRWPAPTPRWRPGRSARRPARGVGGLHRGRRRQGRGQGRREGGRGGPRPPHRPAGVAGPGPGRARRVRRLKRPHHTHAHDLRVRRCRARTREDERAMGRHGSQVRRRRRPVRALATAALVLTLVGLLGWRGWVAVG